MSVLDIMKQKKRERLMPAHTLHGEDVSVRFPYMVGIMMVALADRELTAEKQHLIEDMALSIGMAEEQFSRILATASNIVPDTIDTIVDALDKKEQRFAFILDLYNAGWHDDKTGPEAQEMINVFADMLKLGSSEQKFLQDFAIAALTSDAKKSGAIADAIIDAKIIYKDLPGNLLRDFLIGLNYQDNELLKDSRLYLLSACYREIQGMEKNYAKAVSSTQTGEREKTESQRLLSNSYRIDEGRKCKVETATWFHKAAEQGNALAQNRLGDCYREGKGVAQDYAEAVKWYRKAAEQGNDWAQHNLGLCYRDGLGVKRDKVAALQWFRKASEQGNRYAQESLRKLTRG